jgi:hypothetical protein
MIKVRVRSRHWIPRLPRRSRSPARHRTTSCIGTITSRDVVAIIRRRASSLTPHHPASGTPEPPHSSTSPSSITSSPPREHARRSRSLHDCGFAPPPYYLAGTSFGLSNPRNGTLGEPRSLIDPFPAKHDLPLAGFRRFPSLATARDYIARSEVFLGARTQNPGIYL